MKNCKYVYKGGLYDEEDLSKFKLNLDEYYTPNENDLRQIEFLVNNELRKQIPRQEFNEKAFNDLVEKKEIRTEDINKQKQILDNEIENKLLSWLRSAGVTVNYTDNLTIMDNNGNILSPIAKADLFNKAIQINKNKGDIRALAEETAHFFVAMLPKDGDLFKALAKYTINSPYLTNVQEKYKNVYKEDRLILEEAIGKAIADQLVNTDETNIKIPSKERPYFKKLIYRIIDFVNDLLSKINLAHNNINEEVNALKEAASKILDNDLTDLNEIDKTYKGLTFYELPEEEVTRINNIIDKIKNTKIKVLADGYLDSSGRRIKFRTTQIVRNILRQRFKGFEQEKTKGTIVGTYLHTVALFYLRSKFNNESFDLQKLLNYIKTARDVEGNLYYSDLIPYLDGLSKTVLNPLFDELDRIYDKIKLTESNIQRLIGTNRKAQIFLETPLYNPVTDEAGTPDLFIIYPNGVAAIYDFKSIRFIKDVNDFTEEGISEMKIEEYDLQVERYKNMIRNTYGVSKFAELKIIPIGVNFVVTKDNIFINQIATFASTKKETLREISVAHEESEDVAINATLEKLRALRDKLRTKASTTSVRSNEILRESYKQKIKQVTDAINNILSKDSIYLINTLVESLYQEVELRLTLDENSPDYMDSSALDDIKSFLVILSDYVDIELNNIKSLSEEDKQKIKPILSNINLNIRDMLNSINSKIIDAINTTIPGEEVTPYIKNIGFFTKYFSKLSSVPSSVFKKFSYVMALVKQETDEEYAKFYHNVTTKHENLKKAAARLGLSLQDMFDMLFDENTGNLVTPYNKSFFENLDSIKKSLVNAINEDDYVAAQEYVNKLLKYANVKKVNGILVFEDEALQETFKTLKEKQKNEINIRSKANANLRKKLEAELARWNYRNDISNPDWRVAYNALLHNKFVSYTTEEKQYINERFTKIKRISELYDYYNMIIRFNSEMSSRYGVDIRKNFLPKIVKDIIDRAAQNGIGNALDFKSTLDVLSNIREGDVLLGNIDDANNLIPTIPLLYVNPLVGDLTQSEVEALENTAESKFKKGTVDYENYLSLLIEEARNKKGVEKQSRDLTTSLLLFGYAVHKYVSLNKYEFIAKGLLDYIKKNGRTYKITSKVNPVTDELEYEKVITGDIPTEAIVLLDSFINNFFYGKSPYSEIAKNKLIFSKTGSKKAIKLAKIIPNLLRWLNIRFLGLNPLVAAGNLMGLTTNLLVAVKDNPILKNTTTADWKRYLEYSTKNADTLISIMKNMGMFIRDTKRADAEKKSAHLLSRVMTDENALILMKSGDMSMNIVVATAILDNLTVKNGKIVKKVNEKEESLLSLMNLEEDGSVSIKGLDYKKEEASKENIEYNKNVRNERARLSMLVQNTFSGISGGIPEYDKMNFQNNFLLTLMLHLRTFIPGLAVEKFGGLQYNPYLQDFTVGRFNVLLSELFGEGLSSSLKNITKLMFTLPLVTVKGSNILKISEHISKNIYNRFLVENPEYIGKLDFNQFLELRATRLNAAIREMRIMFMYSLMILGGIILMKGDDDKKKDSSKNSFDRIFYLLSLRGFNEIGFFLNPWSLYSFMSRGPSIFTYMKDIKEITTDLGKESAYALGLLDKPKNDKTPFYYQMLKATPMFNWLMQLTDPFGTYKSYKY